MITHPLILQISKLVRNRAPLDKFRAACHQLETTVEKYQRAEPIDEIVDDILYYARPGEQEDDASRLEIAAHLSWRLPGPLFLARQLRHKDEFTLGPISEVLFRRWFLSHSNEIRPAQHILSFYLSEPLLLREHGPQSTIHWAGKTHNPDPERMTWNRYPHEASQLPWLNDPTIDPAWIFPGLPKHRPLTLKDVLRNPQIPRNYPVTCSQRLDALLTQAEESFRVHPNARQVPSIFQWAARTGLASHATLNDCLRRWLESGDPHQMRTAGDYLARAI